MRASKTEAVAQTPENIAETAPDVPSPPPEAELFRSRVRRRRAVKFAFSQCCAEPQCECEEPEHGLGDSTDEEDATQRPIEALTMK